MSHLRSDRQPPVKILAVIVLYKMRPLDSPALRSLMESASKVGLNEVDARILLYDNTPGDDDGVCVPDGVRYERARQNDGLGGAYDYALRIAENEHLEWLLTLDQDTALPERFLATFAELASRFTPDRWVAGIVPQVADRGRLISPLRVSPGRCRPLRSGFIGFMDREVTGINSGTMWRVESLRTIGGVSDLFWLDYLDAWIFHEIHRRGMRIYIAGNVGVEQQLSILDYKNRMTAPRFQNFLLAESAFCDLYKGGLERALLTLMILCRLLRQIGRGEKKEIITLTWQCLKRRVLVAREERLDEWQRSMRNRAANSTTPVLR